MNQNPDIRLASAVASVVANPSVEARNELLAAHRYKVEADNNAEVIANIERNLLRSAVRLQAAVLE